MGEDGGGVLVWEGFVGGEILYLQYVHVGGVFGRSGMCWSGVPM